MTDLFGKRGREWLAAQHLPIDEHQSLSASLRQLDFVDQELKLIDATIAEQALASPEVRRLLTVPGVHATTAATFMAAVGNIRRFPTARHLVGYLGLDPRVRQSGLTPARHGAISKQGSSRARHVLVEAAWVALQTPGPLRAFGQRIQARRGSNIAVVAVARKMAILFWHLLTSEQDYAFGRPSLTREKIRRIELVAGAQSQRGKRLPHRVFATPEQHRLESQLPLQAEAAYQRMATQWKQVRRGGAGATTGARIS